MWPRENNLPILPAGLPALVGSPKQIAWAESIREKGLRVSLGVIIADLPPDWRAWHGHVITPAEVNGLDILADQHAASQTTSLRAIAWLCEQTSAKWWIDNRLELAGWNGALLLTAKREIKSTAKREIKITYDEICRLLPGEPIQTPEEYKDLIWQPDVQAQADPGVTWDSGLPSIGTGEAVAVLRCDDGVDVVVRATATQQEILDIIEPTRT